MLIVKQGERGPRVVALQILLNRHKPQQIVLEVDGVYGTKTNAAVQAYQAQEMSASGRGDVADSPQWLHLINRQPLQVIEAVDVSDPLLLEVTIPELENFTSPIVTGAMSNGLEQVMIEIKARAKDDKSLLLVRFHGHGAPGLSAVSFGKRSLFPGIDAIAALTVINADTIRVLRPALEKMAPLLCNFGFVELHACKVAHGPEGRKLLQDLAAIWKAPVTAGTGSQNGNGKNNFVLIGQLVTAFPDQQDLSAWAKSRDEAKGITPT
jgi:peptidoglycan hydrolase-like protein with peptidoglycan-binding domain